VKDIMKRWTRYGAMLVTALALAGCQSLIPKAPPQTGPAETPSGPASGPDTVDTGLPSDAARHRVALLLPLSGKDAAVGQSLANATTLALLDTRADTIRITSYDTAKGAKAAADKAIADGNRLILGPLFAEDVSAIAGAARAAKVPIISYSNDVSVAGDSVFVMGYVPAQSIDRVVRYARSEGITRFAGLVPAGTYGQRASAALLEAAKAAGGTVVTLQTYDRGATSLQTAIKRMQQDSAYQAILIADSGAAAIRIVPMLRKAGGADARVLGTELWNTDRSIAGAPALRGAWFASVSDGLYRQYAGKYRNQFGSDPFRLSSLGYDSVLLTTRIARDWKVGSTFPLARLRDPDGFIGIDGAFRFDKNGVAERALEVQQVGTGQLEIVSPAPRGFQP